MDKSGYITLVAMQHYTRDKLSSTCYREMVTI